MGRGTFLVFEGIDASGKSTHARRVAQDRGAHFTFEPGDTALGGELRRWLLDARTSMSPVTEALLMLADRSHHVRTVIEPTLETGTAVVSDRFFASTLAYQGYGRGVDLEGLWAATQLAIEACHPDLTILLDVPLDVANERRMRDARDRFESADVDFHHRVRAGYLRIARENPDNWFVVDATGDEDEVAGVIDERLDQLPWANG